MPSAPRPVVHHHDHCVGCGPRNPGSLGLRFETLGERVRSPLRLDVRHQGAPGFAHGGAVATALDDTLGTLLFVLDRPAVTARLEVDYRRPVFLDTEYVVEGWAEGVDGRKLHLAGDVRTTAGDVVAECRALFLVVAPSHFRQGGSELPDHWGWTDDTLPR